jgi:hypothetical protein
VFYMSTTNENGEERLLKDVDTSTGALTGPQLMMSSRPNWP